MHEIAKGLVAHVEETATTVMIMPKNITKMTVTMYLVHQHG